MDYELIEKYLYKLFNLYVKPQFSEIKQIVIKNLESSNFLYEGKPILFLDLYIAVDGTDEEQEEEIISEIQDVIDNVGLKFNIEIEWDNLA
jgi:hypothetical protein